MTKKYDEAQYKLGYFYLIGMGVEKDAKKGFEWCEKSEKAGNAAAQNLLGSIYYGKDDDKKAFEWYKKAAENGDVEGLVNLGVCYSEGWGLDDSDFKKAFECYKRLPS